MNIAIKRIYEKPDKNDGVRVLIDRLWPRGVSKAEAKLDFWMKDLAPSAELRKWFGHDPEKWIWFKERYFKELDGKTRFLFDGLKKKAQNGKVTLLYSSKDEAHNNATVLKEYLNLNHD